MTEEYRDSFIPVRYSEKAQELLDEQKRRFEEALHSLVFKETPKDVVFQRPARGGIEVDYVPGWWFIDQLNALFNYDWDMEVISHEILWKQKQVWVQGKLVARSGNFVVTKTAFGSSDIKYPKGNSDQPLDIADDLKSAETDAMKKAATMLGIASDVYGKREKLEKGGANRGQLDNLYEIGKDKGLSEEEVDEICRTKFDGKVPKELELIDVLGFMGEIRKMEKRS